jgi:hypothetical protein
LNSFKSIGQDPPVSRPPSPTLLASLSHAVPQSRAMAAGRRPPSSHSPYHRHCNRITRHHDRLLPHPTTRPLGLIHVSTPRAEDVTLHSPPLSLSSMSFSPSGAHCCLPRHSALPFVHLTAKARRSLRQIRSRPHRSPPSVSSIPGRPCFDSSAAHTLPHLPVL